MARVIALERAREVRVTSSPWQQQPTPLKNIWRPYMLVPLVAETVPATQVMPALLLLQSSLATQITPKTMAVVATTMLAMSAATATPMPPSTAIAMVYTSLMHKRLAQVPQRQRREDLGLCTRHRRSRRRSCNHTHNGHSIRGCHHRPAATQSAAAASHVTHRAAPTTRVSCKWQAP